MLTYPIRIQTITYPLGFTGFTRLESIIGTAVIIGQHSILLNDSQKDTLANVDLSNSFSIH